MKSIFVVLLAALSLSVMAQVPPPPEVAARAYLLVDVTANQVLAAKDVDAPVEPASMTKLMTAYLVFDALKSQKIELKQTLPVSERASKMPGSRMSIDTSMQVPVEELLKGMVVQGGNDATVALAEGVGGSAEKFVQLMNDQAKAFGMKNTGYKNPDGMTVPGHVTTARDLSILATHLIADFPQYVGFFSIKKYRYPGTPVANENNRNVLLFRDPTVDGLIVGSTDAAGYCMIATAKRDFPGLVTTDAPTGTAAANGSRRLLSIVLGAESENVRANESQKLLNWGYAAFEAVKLFDANQAVISPAIWKGTSPAVKLGRTQSIVVAVPNGAAAKLKTQIVRADPLVAPVVKGQQLATLRVTAADQPVADVPLEALDGVEQAGILGRAWDALRLWIQ